MTNLKKFALVSLAVLAAGCVGQAKTDQAEAPVQPTTPTLMEEVEVKEVDPRMVCVGCTNSEQITVDFLFDRGITETRAMSVVLGNIKQESNFHPNICEGGARVPYEKCWTGGFGIIQWTTTGRYDGLGHFAKSYGGNPSELRTQLRYMVNEKQWIDIEPFFIKGGLTTQRYMDYAYDWLGWGIYGNRGRFSEQYLQKLKVIA
jgi:hypothetical protein